MKVLGDLNNEQFLAEAFDLDRNPILLKSARRRRNIYLGLVITAVICIFAAAIANHLLLVVLSLLLALLSLVVMSKYDTQIYFLRTIQQRKQTTGTDGESEAEPNLTEENHPLPSQEASL